MLILTRKPGESIIIEPDPDSKWVSDPRCWFVDGPIRVRVNGVRSTQVKIGIEAPRMFKILRDELYKDLPPTIALNLSVRDSLASKVRLLRRLRGWSVDELGNSARISLKTVLCIESGNGLVKLSDLEALANAFEVSVVELLLPPGRTARERLLIAGRGNGE